MFFECNHHSSAQVAFYSVKINSLCLFSMQEVFQSEHQWLSSFTEVNKDESGELVAHATLLFSQLYRVSYLNKFSLL